jgi:DNA-binding XRE family transcriptional regulator
MKPGKPGQGERVSCGLVGSDGSRLSCHNLRRDRSAHGRACAWHARQPITRRSTAAGHATVSPAKFKQRLCSLVNILLEHGLRQPVEAQARKRISEGLDQYQRLRQQLVPVRVYKDGWVRRIEFATESELLKAADQHGEIRLGQLSVRGAGKMTVGVSGSQMRAVRALIGASQSDIAAAAGVTRQTIERMERSGSQPVISRNATVAAVLALSEPAV